MKVEIRLLQELDAHTSVKWRNDPEVWKLTGSRPDKKVTLEEELQWIRRVMADSSSRRFAILAGGTYIGNIYLTDIKDGEAEYHIFLGDKAYWGKGIAKTASKMLLNYAKDTLLLHTVVLSVRKANTAAIALYSKLGFREADEDSDFLYMEFNLAKQRTKPA
jgi:diamine N-acetyltransferase